MANKIIDVNFTEVNNATSKNYHTIEEVGELLSVDISKIIYWCNKFNDILNIQSLGMYKIFSKSDIDNLKIIKELNIDKNMSVNEIIEYLNQNKSAIMIKKEIEVPEVSLLTVIAKILSSQNEKIETLIDAHDKMLNLNQQLIKNQEEFMNKIGESQKEICTDIENKTNSVIESQEQQKIEMLDRDKLHEEEIKTLKDEITKLNETVIDRISSIEQDVTANLLDREAEMKRHMEEKKNYQKLLEDIQLQNKNKSLWQRIRNK